MRNATGCLLRDSSDLFAYPNRVIERPETNPLSAISSGKALNRKSSVLWVSEQSRDDAPITHTETFNLLDSGL